MKKNSIKEIVYSSKILIIGVIFSILYWMIEAILHTLFFNVEGDFFYHLFTSDLHELWMRSITSMFLVLFSIIIYLSQSRKKKLNLKVEEVKSKSGREEYIYKKHI
jgi:hypothetical protein